ncbi:hypothetical protein As57867_017379, partial [Aphanomyces stellatus]
MSPPIPTPLWPRSPFPTSSVPTESPSVNPTQALTPPPSDLQTPHADSLSLVPIPGTTFGAWQSSSEPTTWPLSTLPFIPPVIHSTIPTQTNGWTTTTTDQNGSENTPQPPHVPHSAEPSQTTTSSLSSTSIGLIVSAVVCTLVVVGCLARRVRQKQSKVTSTLSSFNSHHALHWQGLGEMQIDIEVIQIKSRLAAGNFGEVFLGSLHGQIVAVKTCTKTTLPDIQAFIDELALLATLTSPTIVTLVGVAWTKATDLKAVLEYMNMGDLRDVLAKTTAATLPWQAKLECALSVAKALVYLKERQ